MHYLLLSLCSHCYSEKIVSQECFCSWLYNDPAIDLNVHVFGLLTFHCPLSNLMNNVQCFLPSIFVQDNYYLAIKFVPSAIKIFHTKLHICIEIPSPSPHYSSVFYFYLSLKPLLFFKCGKLISISTVHWNLLLGFTAALNLCLSY